MVNVRLPLAVYGKPAEASADAGGYRFLARHPAFDPPPLDRALRRLVAALEWKPAPHRHPPVYGLLREGESTLVARFLDAGRDATGRPHALRVECVLVDPLGPAGALLDFRNWETRDGDRLLISGMIPSVALPPALADDGRIILLGNEDRFARAANTIVATSTSS